MRKPKIASSTQKRKRWVGLFPVKFSPDVFPVLKEKLYKYVTMIFTL